MTARLSMDPRANRVATRLAFLVAGCAIGCWAPLVPFAKQRLSVDDATLGVLLLCIGVGSLVSMIATGPLSIRFGTKPVILCSGMALTVVLPFLTIAATPTGFGVLLLLFGAALGSLDVAMNVHALAVEQAAGRPLMSGFHALFSIGGFTGSVQMTLLLWAGLPAVAGASICGGFMFVVMLFAAPCFLTEARGAKNPSFVIPNGVVLLLAGLAMAIFLTEGAMLDWSALLIAQTRLAEPAQAGIGYILFAAAMTGGRLFGDALVARLGERRTLIGGGAFAVAGFITLLGAPAPLALIGFLMIGLGASNIVPVLFRLAGGQSRMPPALAISAITTIGYAGILIGPAGIGLGAKVIGLKSMFWGLAVLTALVPLAANWVTQGRVAETTFPIRSSETKVRQG